MKLNNEDSGNRKFILIELEKEICKNSTAKRLQKIIQGYVGKRTKQKTPGLNSTFQYCVLGEPLFDKDGKIDINCSFEDLASYVYFTETKTILDKNKISKNFIGTNDDIEYYLIFKEIGQNILNKDFLSKLDKDRLKIIYADNCTIADDTLEQYHVIFKQIPYEVRLF